MAPTAAYIHIPFCRRRCFYCDFPIAVVGDHPAPPRLEQYITTLCSEIRLTTPLFPTDQPLQTVFFGGGTPSLLSGSQLGQVLATLDRQFGIAPEAEISMEIDPGTFDLLQLQSYQQVGINRFSFGVQAFQADLLQHCGRAHTVDDIATAMTMIQQAGITNFSLDLISGLPTQTIDQWQASLAAAIAHQPTHISTYDLTIEAGTVFGKRYRPGDQPLPSDTTTATMYRIAHHTLTAAGYEHYEISNYAKPGFQCRHNRVYWENRPFYGFGMGATSYLNGDRFPRPRQIEAYDHWAKALASGLPESAAIDPQELLLDTLMVGLRLAEGLSITDLSDQFGTNLIHQVLQTVQRYLAVGWVEMLDAQGNSLTELTDLATVQRLRLTTPEGFMFSNVVLVELFDRLSI
jgi:putative oxygen-independent coproporphyrinogen III oxidase